MHHLPFLTFQESTLQFTHSAWGIPSGRAPHAKREKAQHITIALSCQVVPFSTTASAGAGAGATAAPEVDRWAAQRMAQQCLSIRYVEELAEAGKKKLLDVNAPVAWLFVFVFFRAPCQAGLTATPLDDLMQANLDEEPWRID